MGPPTGPVLACWGKEALACGFGPLSAVPKGTNKKAAKVRGLFCWNVWFLATALLFLASAFFLASFLLCGFLVWTLLAPPGPSLFSRAFFLFSPFLFSF